MMADRMGSEPRKAETRKFLGARASAKAAAFAGAMVCACVLFGAIPWLSVPTLAQALWASGFAQSYANAGGWAIYATDFGQPLPAPISFGLSATFIQGLIIHVFGMGAIDAYTLTVVLYLGIALYGAMALARSLGASYYLAVAGALLWLALPIVWEHVGFSMVALGFALLPLYLHAVNRLLVVRDVANMSLAAGFFCLVAILAVFMDGYTFVMFFVAAAIVWTGSVLTDRGLRKHALLFVLPTLTSGFFVAYLLYTSFIGGFRYAVFSRAFFRGWGVDVTMLLVPTRGIHLLWDALGLSSTRNQHMFWGDASVWITTFLLPLIIAAICGFAVARERKRAWLFLAMAVVGVYLSLGPSLKINSTKQVPGITAVESGPLMPARFAVMPTGSGWLSMHVPGFREMRAAYRWLGLGALGFWALTIMLLLRLHQRRPTVAYGTTFVLMAMFLPHVSQVLDDAIANRRDAADISGTLGRDLGSVAGRHGMLLFVPHGNDFIVNYLAATAGFKTYNIGGDKNVEMAQRGWSERARNLNFSNLHDPLFLRELRTVLLVGEADAVILPYFDTLQAAIAWPPRSASVLALQDERLAVARAAAASPCFRLRQFPLFAAVSLSEKGQLERERLFMESDQAATMAVAFEDCAIRR